MYENSRNPQVGASQVVEGPRFLQAVPPSQVCHNAVADLARRRVPETLDEVHVLVDPAPLADLLQAHEHFPNSIAAGTT